MKKIWLYEKDKLIGKFDTIQEAIDYMCGNWRRKLWEWWDRRGILRRDS